MKKRMLGFLAGFLVGLCSQAFATEPAPDLPPAALVARVLRASPAVRAAVSQVHAEEAQRARLEAGDHEWNLRLGRQQRKALPPTGPLERFNEWNVALERPLRLPGKAALDADLGTAGVALAEMALGDALHEASRGLLNAWFAWCKESAAAAQWALQTTLLEEQAKAIARRQQLGDAARLETLLAEANLAQARAQLAQARARQGTGAEKLRRHYPGLPLEEPKNLSEPLPITGGEAAWVAAILEHNHELGMARIEAQRARLVAQRARRDRQPDPTFGIHVASERGGEDRLIGAYLSIPLPGDGRRATATAALAQSEAAGHREAAATQKITAEAAGLYYAASAARATWQAGRDAAAGLARAADMSTRAYQLGEGSLNDLLAARRLANEAQLAARLAQLDALELRYRLLLDTHRLWVLDEEHSSLSWPTAEAAAD